MGRGLTRFPRIEWHSGHWVLTAWLLGIVSIGILLAAAAWGYATQIVWWDDYRADGFYRHSPPGILAISGLCLLGFSAFAIVWSLLARSVYREVTKNRR